MAQQRRDPAPEPAKARPELPAPELDLPALIPEAGIPDDELLGGDAGLGIATRVVNRELGTEWGRRMGGVWQRLSEWEELSHAGEGLRERKKRETRQRVSDVATALFLARGYDNVRIAEIAEIVGVSEKTIYNYFPTKESLVYDQADEQLMRLASAVRDRPADSSPTAAFVTALKEDVGRFNNAVRDSGPRNARLAFLTAFAEMIRDTPALRSAWGEHRHLMVATLTALLAEEAGVDPRDPEPISTARALVSLLELVYDAQMRHIEDGIDADDLQAAVEADLDRGARLLDTGLWSFHLMVEGRKTKDQLRDAAITAEQARQQVMRALREAKQAFREIRDEAKAAGREIARNAAREVREDLRESQRKHRESQQQHREQVREAQKQHREQARQQGGQRLRGKGR